LGGCRFCFQYSYQRRRPAASAGCGQDAALKQGVFKLHNRRHRLHLFFRCSAAHRNIKFNLNAGCLCSQAKDPFPEVWHNRNIHQLLCIVLAYFTTSVKRSSHLSVLAECQQQKKLEQSNMQSCSTVPML
jgi:hypothetical protein